jgi:hypothetical protein
MFTLIHETEVQQKLSGLNRYTHTATKEVSMRFIHVYTEAGDNVGCDPFEVIVSEWVANLISTGDPLVMKMIVERECCLEWEVVTRILLEEGPTDFKQCYSRAA